MPEIGSFIRSIRLNGFLSFGPEAAPVVLGPLNVLIGPNGSGKSNFVEAMSVLRAVPGDLPVPIRRGGGVKEWLWKGPGREAATEAVVELEIDGVQVGRTDPVRYRIGFAAQGEQFVVRDERLEDARPAPGKDKPFFFFGYENGRPMLSVKGEKNRRELHRESIDPAQSILSQRRDPEAYPELTNLAVRLGRILLYREWSFGPDAAVRAACRADVRADILNESLDNLPMRMMELKRDPGTKYRIEKLLREISSDIRGFDIFPEGGTLGLFLDEGGRIFPSRRLSDGTIRFLCLAAILVDPAPPPLVVLEEPELGLHPDILPVIRDLLVEASTRTQLVVTTHSTQLADAMTDHAEAMLVCEKHDASTTLVRLEQAEVDRWKAEGGLGRLWMSGRLGGTRW